MNAPSDVNEAAPVVAEEPRRTAEASTHAATTPVWVWVVYGLGLLAATIFLASALLLAFAWAATGNGSFGIHVSTPAFVIWLALAVAAAVTFVWRRYGNPR